MKNLHLLQLLTTVISLSCVNEDKTMKGQGATKAVTPVAANAEANSETASNNNDSSENKGKNQNPQPDDNLRKPRPQPVETPVAGDREPVKSSGPESPKSCITDVVGIVGGVPVKESTLIIRSTAKLWLINTDCTATLIGPRHLVTAAHCLRDPTNTPIDIRYGTTSNDPAKRIPVDKWVMHPLWKSGLIPYDIGVLTLKSDVPVDFVPVAIASPNEIVPGLELIITGYGRLAETSTAARPLNMVKAVIATSNKTERHFSTVIDGTGSCYGDSGGPGYIVDKTTKCLKAMGVVSKASTVGNGICGQGDTMMDMTRFQGWIAASFKQLGAPLPGLINDGSEVDAAMNLPRP